MTTEPRRKAMGALGWEYPSAAARIAAQFASAVLLARMLGPEPFGLAAAAWAMVGAASQFADCGFGSALVERNEIGPREIRFAFTLQAVAGVAMAGRMAGAPGWLARPLGNPALGSVIAVLSLVLLLQARRNFRTLQLAQLAGAAVRLLCVILAAVPLAGAAAVRFSPSWLPAPTRALPISCPERAPLPGAVQTAWGHAR